MSARAISLSGIPTLPPPYTRLTDASSLAFHGTPLRVSSPQQYLGWHADMVERAGIAQIWQCADLVRARVNHGRWIADCLHCRTGMPTHPEWCLACCAQCGAIYEHVEFPPDRAALERVLLSRPNVENQNWEPGETIGFLEWENFRNGVVTRG